MIEIVVGFLCLANMVTWILLRKTQRGLVIALKIINDMISVIELQQKLRLLDKIGENVDEIEAEFQRIIKDFRS